MLTKNYKETLSLIKTEITLVRIKVTKKVVSEHINHYLAIGKIILKKTRRRKMGEIYCGKISNRFTKRFS